MHHPLSSTSTTSIGLAYSSNGAPIRSNYRRLTEPLSNPRRRGCITGISMSGLMLGVDGIREFRVITNNFPAEYGMVMEARW